MLFRDLTPPKLNLSRQPGELPLEVNMEAFFEFSFWMAESLEDLVTQTLLNERQMRTARRADRALPVGAAPARMD